MKIACAFSVKNGPGAQTQSWWSWLAAAPCCYTKIQKASRKIATGQGQNQAGDGKEAGIGRMAASKLRRFVINLDREVLGGWCGLAGWQAGPGRSVAEVAIYPVVVWLASRSLRARSASYRSGV
jgi:hypothetical protein